MSLSDDWFIFVFDPSLVRTRVGPFTVTIFGFVFDSRLQKEETYIYGRSVRLWNRDGFWIPRRCIADPLLQQRKKMVLPWFFATYDPAAVEAVFFCMLLHTSALHNVVPLKVSQDSLLILNIGEREVPYLFELTWTGENYGENGRSRFQPHSKMMTGVRHQSHGRHLIPGPRCAHAFMRVAIWTEIGNIFRQCAREVVVDL